MSLNGIVDSIVFGLEVGAIVVFIQTGIDFLKAWFRR